MLVTLALERRYKLHEGTRSAADPVADRRRDDRHAAGDRPGILETGKSPADRPGHRRRSRPRPVQGPRRRDHGLRKAGDTLKSINEAASGLAEAHQECREARRVPHDRGPRPASNVSKAAQGIDRVHQDQRGRLPADGRQSSPGREQAQRHVRPGDQDAFKIGHRSVLRPPRPGSTPGSPRSTRVLKDLGAPVNHTPTTDFGQAVRRINLLAADLELLTSKLRDGRGGLNTDGSLQKLLTQAELHDNFNTMAVTATQALAQLKTVLASLRDFAEKVSRDPGAHRRGALQAR